MRANGIFQFPLKGARLETEKIDLLTSHTTGSVKLNGKNSRKSIIMSYETDKPYRQHAQKPCSHLAINLFQVT